MMILETREISADVLVVGGGGAGTIAAIKAMTEGAEVLVATKGPFPSGNTSVASAGYSVALGHADSRDNPEVHFEDLIRGGNGLNNRRVVRAWVREIVDLTKELDTWGIGLIREGDNLAQRTWDGYTYPRMVHHERTTGKVIMECLRQKSKDMDVQALAHTTVGGLLKGDEGILGAWGIQNLTGQLLFIKSKAVILATGGMGHLFPITDNVETITGEGYSLAFRAGAELIDMEIIHFLPTFYYPSGMKARRPVARPIVASLNDGRARLYNGLGERFMKKQYGDTGEKNKIEKLITQSIGLELCEGRVSAHGGVYLDVSDVPPEMLKLFFSTALNELKTNRIDVRYQPIELALNPHDMLGGVRIDETGVTNVRGLFAAGEAAGGSHGAARLGGSALSDALAFGSIAGRSAAHYARQLKKQLPWDDQQVQEVQNRVKTLQLRKEGIKPSELRKSIQMVAYRYLNTVRNEEGLKKALQELKRIEQEMLPKMSASESGTGKKVARLSNAIEVEGQLELAKLIATAALCRQESRGGPYGGHYRSDYPSQDDKNWLKNIILKNEEGAISYRTVTTPKI